MSKITESTLIPLSLVITIVGGVFWLTVMWSKTEASAKDIEKIKTDIYQQNLEILQRLSRIEGALKERGQ